MEQRSEGRRVVMATGDVGFFLLLLVTCLVVPREETALKDVAQNYKSREVERNSERRVGNTHREA